MKPTGLDADSSDPKGLPTGTTTTPRIVFLGRNNPFSLGIIDALSENFDIVGAFFVEPDRFGWRARWRRIRARIRKYGVPRVADELAFHAWYWLFDKRSNMKLMAAHLPARFLSLTSCTCPRWDVADPHAPEWIAKLRELKPDLVFAVCCSVILRKQFYSVPRLGAFVLHEGMAPEYKGLHSPLWALVEGNQDGIGYTLLQVTDSIDGGPIVAQRRVAVAATHPRHWSFIGHAALVAGIPAVEEALMRLVAAGRYEPVSTDGRPSRYFTWMRLSTYLWTGLFGPLKRRDPAA